MLNAIDHHNQSHQSDLGLEKQWVTKDCYFPLVTTLLGMQAVDCWKMADYHGIINSKAMEENKMSIKTFCGHPRTSACEEVIHLLRRMISS